MTRTINQRLEIARKKGQKKEKMMEKRKIKAMAAKRQRAKKRISLSNKKKRNYESDTGDKTDLDQANNEYLLPIWEVIGGKL